MRDEQVGPEWAGYVAAFDAHIDARKRGDDQLAAQSRRLMRWFAESVRDVTPGKGGPATDADIKRSRTTIEHDLEPLLEQIGLL